MTTEHQPETARERDYTAMLLRQLRKSNVEIWSATEGELTRVMSLLNPKREVNLLHMSDSTIYGWFDANGITLTEAGLNPNTLAHEYTHGFMAMLSLDNKPLYERIVKDLKDSPVWKEVLEDKGYTGVTKDETRVASEVAARIVGNESELRASEGITAKVLRAIQDFWDYVQEKLGIDKEKRMNPRRITNIVMKDLVSLGDQNRRLTGAIDKIAVKRLNQEKVNAIPRVLYDILEKEFGKDAAEELSTTLYAKVDVFRGDAETTDVWVSRNDEDLKRMGEILGVMDGLPSDDLEYVCRHRLESLLDITLHYMDLSPYFQSELMVEIGDWREDYERKEITKFAETCDNAHTLLQSVGFKQNTNGSIAWGEYSYNRTEENGFSFHFKSNSKEPVEFFADYDEDEGRAVFEYRPIDQNYPKELNPDQWLKLLQQQVIMKQEEIKDMENTKKQNNTDGRSAEEKALDTFTDLLITKIESMQSDWKKPWFTEGVGTNWPKNASGREYNGGNALMLSLQAEKMGYKLPVWMTFDRVNMLNFKKGKDGKYNPVVDNDGNKLPHVGVQKGEKGFPVFLTVFKVINPETKEKINYDDWKNLTQEERQKYNVYPKQQVYTVFNVGQTNIEQARPELYKKFQEQSEVKKPELNGEEYSFPPMDRMINENLWICPIKPTHGDDAYYSISKHEIVVPEKAQFKDGESFYSNLFHEMNHSVHSEGYLNLLKPTSFGSKEYAVEELRAELGAAVVASRYGMVKNLKEDSAAYLKSWLDSIKEKPDFLKSVIMDVKRSTNIMTQRIDKIQLAIDEGRQIDRAQFIANDYKPENNIKEEKAAKMPGRTSATTETTQETQSQTEQEQVTHGRSR